MLKPLGILLLAFGLAGAAAVVVYRGGSYDWEKNLPSGQGRFLTFEPGAVARITLKDGTSSVTLRREAGGWKVEGREEPADGERVSRVLARLAESKAAQLAKATPSQLMELKLVLPDKENWAGSGTLVTLEDGAGRPLALLLAGRKHLKEGDDRPEEEGTPVGRFFSRLKEGQPPEEVALLSDPFWELNAKPESWVRDERNSVR